MWTQIYQGEYTEEWKNNNPNGILFYDDKIKYKGE